MRYSGTTHTNCAHDVDIEVAQPHLVRGCQERRRFPHAGHVHKCVDLPVSSECVVDQLVHLSFGGDIATLDIRGRDNVSGDDQPAVTAKSCCGCGSDTTRRASDNHYTL